MASSGSATSTAVSSHHKNTRDLITWRGNENDSMRTTYRSHFERSCTPSAETWNEVEPLHIRTNLHLQRRHVRAASAPPPRQPTAAPLLAWNDLDETYSSKPGVGSRILRNQRTFERPSLLSQSAPPSAPTSGYTVSETLTPLNTT